MAKKKTVKKKVVKKKVSKKSVKLLTPKQKQIQENNKTLIGILSFLGGMILVAFLIMFLYNQTNIFDYKTIEFEKINEGRLIFYRTSFPVLLSGNEVPYNVYIRTHPEELEKINSDAEIKLRKNMVINGSDSFDCDGDEVIAFANLVKFYSTIGTKVIKDENATCDNSGRYVYVNVIEGNTTEIKELGEACYEISIANCEILEGTEKFLAESIVQFRKEYKY